MSKYKAMGGGGTRGSLEAEHTHYAVYNVVGKFQVAVSVGHCAMFKEALWGSAITWWVTARGWGWGWFWGWSRGWGRRGRRWKRVRQRQSDGGIRRRRGGRGGRRRRCACARARSLGDVVGDRREREVRRRVVVVMGLDRTKVSTVSLRESARAVQTDII